MMMMMVKIGHHKARKMNLWNNLQFQRIQLHRLQSSDLKPIPEPSSIDSFF